MIHPSTEVRSAGEEVGLGVFATEDLPKGTILWVLDRFDRVIDPAVAAHWPAPVRSILERYGYIDAAGSVVVCWDEGRLMNHSCDPVTVSVGGCFEVARRDVRKGEELTCDYGLLNMTGAFDCACGLPACRGVVSATGAEQLITMWDGWAADAFLSALEVPQPLLPFARAEGADQDLATALAERRSVAVPPIRSVLRSGAKHSAGSAARLWSLG